MSADNNFDSLWDYTEPEETERKFREALAALPQDAPTLPELLTQIARAQGLQHKFDEAHRTLDLVATRLESGASRARVRYLLERGRLFNSSGQPEQARPLYEQAEALATQLGEDFHAVDAIHMLAILAEPPESLHLNLRAIQRAELSQQEKAKSWLGSLYNNTGWSYHNLGDYGSALDMFQRAEAWQRSQGREYETQVARWTVARTLRSMNKIEEALSRQRELEREFAEAGEEDGYVFEEIGECLLALERAGEARLYFAKAYAALSQDPWLAGREPERLQRLKRLGKMA